MRIRTIIFAKVPKAGFAKTRLIPALGADGAARLARRLLKHALEQASTAAIGEVELCRTPMEDALWKEMALPRGILVSDQGDGDLGDRLARAARRAMSNGRACILIGTDCPGLDANRLRRVAAELRGHDAVIVPAKDGGYVALALRTFEPWLFQDMAWSTASVAATTIGRLKAAGRRTAILDALHDVDEPEDLLHLPQSWKEVPGHGID